ncbi:hypothetical protein POTOM_011323 [Populus tomentosa]|uniref:TF-B3 domain-containing protein n=1 Tax=Populus tomentosa TaxID=118781 RepID=A0A8X8A8N7_POPTO|nr:hypothetical protein POTOM_011323 [Populus tomentosa]
MAPVSPDVALSSAGSPTSGAVCVSHMLSDLPNSPVPSPAGSPSRFASPAQPSPLLHSMEIFTKQITSIDIDRGLVLPPDSKLESLPPFHGARTIELSTIVVKSAAGITTLPGGEPVTIHCSTRSGRLTFTRGWYDIARDVGLGSGDIVTFYQEVNGGKLFKMRVRNVG